MDRALIAAENRRQMPAAYAMVDELLAEWKPLFPGIKVMHMVDHTTQMEVGTPGDRVKPEEMVARRCDEKMRWSDESA